VQGVIMDEMRQYVAERYGYKAWIETLRRSGHTVTYQYQLDQVYPDEELGLLARHAADVTGTPPLELLKAFGQAMVPDMIRIYSYLIEDGWSYPEFLVHMEPLLHQALQLHKPGANQLRIHATPVAADLVTLTYDSPLRACATVEGVILGAAKEYGVQVEVVQDRCLLRGDPICSFNIRIRPAGPYGSRTS
jgi:predicted hydrocarbon binding protein